MIDSYAELGQLVTPFYIVHALVVAAYFPARGFLVGRGYTFFSEEGHMTTDWLSREQEIWTVAFIFYFMKSRKVATIQQLAELTILYSKFAATASLALASYGAGVAYVLLLAAAFVGVRQSRFRGDDRIEDLNAVTFAQRVRDPKKHGGPHPEDYKTMWVVVFHADWCPKATSLYPLFAKLSVKEVDPERRKWARLDLEQFPQFAKEFSIDLDPLTTKQLPTVIVFYKGKEERRLPLFTSSGQVVDCAFSEQTLTKVLELKLTVKEIRRRRKEGN